MNKSAARRLFPIAAFLLLVAPARAQSLGETTFPNSGAQEAQEPFTRGLLLLHSFEYDDARAAFQEAREIDPTFAMAMWGEALTHNHPIWQEQDTDAAWQAMTSFGDYPDGIDDPAIKASERERAYLKTLWVLFDPLSGDKESRDDAFAEALGELTAGYPDDENAASLHALAILGTAHEGRDFEIYDRAGQIALEVFERNPRHPGAAHYVIHAYDDPMNAEKALDAARAYSEIAPDAPHALHMPSHIYFALGMWEEGSELNLRSYQAARRRDEAAGQPLGGHGWHPLYWLHYAELQRGRFDEASQLFNEALELAEAGQTSRGWSSIIAMRANYVIETEDWTGEIAQLDLPLGQVSAGTALRDAFVRGLVALHLHHHSALDTALQDVQKYLEGGEELGPAEQAMALMLEGLVLTDQDQSEDGVDLLRQATVLEDQMPLDFGPPNPPKPAHELLGEMLLNEGLAAEAQSEFEKALERAPRRLHSLVGLARAARAKGDDATAASTEEVINEIISGRGEGGGD